MPRLEIELRGPLLVAGTRSPAIGIDASTTRRFHRGQWVPVIPASALRGAVRGQLEALLTGAGRRVTPPYPYDGTADTSPGPGEPAAPDDPVARLFGYSARRGQRSGGGSGCVRFGDGVPDDPERAAASLVVRPGVEIDDLTGAAADHKLYFREVADGSAKTLRFTAPVDVSRDTRPDDVELLRRAVEWTGAVGAAKAAGGGDVRIRWRDDDGGDKRLVVTGPQEGARCARLVLRAREPLHLGDGGPIGNFHGTRSHIPGATLRGAVAWALLRTGRVRADEPAFQRSFVEEGSALSFGDALPVVDEAVAPAIVPVTRRRFREDGEMLDLLPSELARERVQRLAAAVGAAVHLRGEAGERKLEALPARPASRLLHRVRTRVAIDRLTGTAAEGRLFSIEQIEPWTAPGGNSGSRPATFIARIEGLDEVGAELLTRLDGVDLLVGGRTQQGLGRMDAELTFLPEREETTALAEATARVHALADEVDRLTGEYAERARLAAERSCDEMRLLPVALVATSDFVADAGRDHPLAWIDGMDVEPVRRFVTAASSGGYDQRPRHAREAIDGPLKPLATAIAAGSVFVYEVRGEALEGLLAASLPALGRGVGRRQESGCGRFEVFRWPMERLSAQQEEAMTPTNGLTIEIKNELVEKATQIAQDARNDRQGTSQLRNLLQISQTESEVAVLTNFIQYQAARQATGNFWGGIHRSVIEALEWIAERVPDDPASRRTAFQHFFGYLVRAYVYEKRDRRREAKS